MDIYHDSELFFLAFLYILQVCMESQTLCGRLRTEVNSVFTQKGAFLFFSQAIFVGCQVVKIYAAFGFCWCFGNFLQVHVSNTFRVAWSLGWGMRARSFSSVFVLSPHWMSMPQRESMSIYLSLSAGEAGGGWHGLFSVVLAYPQT